MRLLFGHRTIDLDGRELLIGRHSRCDIVLDGADVSREHCRLVRTSAGWEVEDLNSLNGVSVNGVPVGRALLRPGDRLAVGGVLLTAEAVAADAPVLRSIAAALTPLRRAG